MHTEDRLEDEMSGITKCTDEECVHKECCYRYVASPDAVRQSYFTKSPLRKDGACDYFIESDGVEED